ncbi:DUF6801 domain-containing protein [Dermacoccaceae bacterium W4C1]
MHRTRATRQAAAVTGIAGLALAGSAFMSAPADAASKTFSYSCTTNVPGLGDVDTSTWSVTIDVDLPAQVTAGEEVDAPAVTAAATVPSNVVGLLNLIQGTAVAGTATADYSIDGTEFDAALTIPSTSVPASGTMVANASGSGTSNPQAPPEETTSEVTVGDFVAQLKIAKSDGSTQDATATCVLPSGADDVLGTIEVVADDSEPTSTEPTPTSTTDEPTATSTTDEPTATSTTDEPTATSTTDEPTTSTDEATGPPVQTDELGGGDNAGAAALGLLTFAGVATAAFASRRRINRD